MAVLRRSGHPAALFVAATGLHVRMLSNIFVFSMEPARGGEDFFNQRWPRPTLQRKFCRAFTRTCCGQDRLG
jgi:hypothetical protein